MDFLEFEDIAPKPALQQHGVSRRWQLKIDIDVDLKFFAILPAININLHSKQLEFEWLFIGIYAGFCSANGG